MQAKNLKKQAAAKARSAALTPAQRSKIAAKAALKKAGYPSAEYVGTLSLGKLFKKRCCQAEWNNLKKAGYPSAEYVGTLSLGKLFKKRCCQAEWNKNVPFGFS